MCGIGGVYHLGKEKINHALLKSMSDIIHYRGPDGDGIWMNDNSSVGFVHRRLAIIDLNETGKQPMMFDNGRYVITYNGEIYNYKELKEDLIKAGYKFNSTSDTEVLLALYDQKKAKCLDYLDGMFSFAIYDNKARTMFCARDRFGEKPFHYYKDKNIFLFGSEIKQLSVYKKDLKINLKAIQKYLDSKRIALDQFTYVEEVFALKPAHFIWIEDGSFAVHSYWDIHLEKQERRSSSKEYIDGFKNLFLTSIARRMRSDVEIGSCLSGGMDSSSIVCGIKSISTNPLKTFSARFDDPIKDEGKWIEEVIRASKAQNFEVYPDAGLFLEELDELLYHHEFPIASTSQYAQWCVYRLASINKVKVLLDGQGADEYLAGYDDLKYFAIWQLYREMKFRDFFIERKYLRKNWNNKSSTGFLFLFDPILKLLGIKRSVYNLGYSFRERLKYSTMHELGELLRYGDRSSMAFSLEVRLPFLNHELVEYTFSLPNEMIYKDGATKFVLRKAVEGLIPKAIFNRYDKIGFAPPQQKWLENPIYQDAYEKASVHLKSLGLKSSKAVFNDIIASRLIFSLQKLGCKL
jgi:asparagine synthase (glutamine-hydrolysing)